MRRMHKYPRTPHIEGSRPQPGDHDLEIVPFESLAGRHLVVEEKIDGANAGISFDADGRLWLQSRGHFLTGGARERQFDLFKAWASCHQERLFAALGSHYVLYGEWLFAKHTLFYDALPHYFLEFDVLDTRDGMFLSTERRSSLLEDLPLVSVPILNAGLIPTVQALQSLIEPSQFKSADWRARLAKVCASLGQDPDAVAAQTDPSDTLEGLYIKVEEDGQIVGRYKFVRSSFLTAVSQSGDHWQNRPIIPNQLRDGVDLFAYTL